MPTQTQSLSPPSELKMDKVTKENLKYRWFHDSLEFWKERSDDNSSPPKDFLIIKDNQNSDGIPIKQDSRNTFCEEDDEENFDFDLESFEVRWNLDCEDNSSSIFEEEEDNSSIFEDEEEISYVLKEKDSKETDLIQNEMVNTPFWFGCEDEKQLQCIHSTYFGNLKLAQEQQRCIRQPEPFMGRIRRQKVDNGSIFTTLDEVEVFRRSTVPPGSVMPFVRTVNLLTCWSYDEGLPTDIVSLSRQSLEKWTKKIVKEIPSSTLLCLPEYGTKAYHFSVTSETTDVTHSPSSLHKIEKRNWYQKYIPSDLKHSQEDLTQ